MKTKNIVWSYVATIILLIYLYIGVFLFFSIPDLRIVSIVICAAMYLSFLFLFLTFTFHAIVKKEDEKPKRFFIIEVEKWMSESYEKIYFTKEEWYRSIYIYGFLYKKQLKETEINFEFNPNYFLSEEEAMREIILSVRKIMKLSKEEENKIIKSIKCVKTIQIEEVIKNIENKIIE